MRYEHLVHTPLSDRADTRVAERIHERREKLGISKVQLARALGISFQQVGKYEGKLNRVMAGRLYEIAGLLGVPVGYFYEGLPGADTVYEPPGTSPTARFVRDVMSIKNEAKRQGVFDTTRVLAGGEQKE